MLVTRALVMVALATCGVVAVGPSEVGARPSPAQQISEEGAGQDLVVVETFSISGQLQGVAAYDANGAAVPVPVSGPAEGAVPQGNPRLVGGTGGVVALGSGSGGTSSASGCRRVTVRNEKESTFGSTLYWFNTWTEWCWNRTTKVVSSVSTGWSINDVDSLQVWHGVVNDQRYFYSWQAGASKSGYYHYKQGHFENCFLVACGANTYPSNTLRSFANGTWSWSTGG